MPSIFSSKKERILSQLSLPSNDYTDASPKGSVDEPIRSLVSDINAVNSLVTTSSCSGRIAVYVEGQKKHDTRRLRLNGTSQAVGDDGDQVDGDLSSAEAPDSTEALTTTATSLDNASRASAQGKGGGAWLFVSHAPLERPPVLCSTAKNELPGASEPVGPPDSALQQLLASPQNETTSSTSAHDHIRTDCTAPFPPGARLVHLKFEPLILHILCASVTAARKVLVAASAAGFRESGASGLPDLPGAATSGEGQRERDGRAAQGDEGVEGRKYPRRERKTQKVRDASVMVAVRTMGLGMDAPIGYVGDADEVVTCVSDAYLVSLLRLGNERFRANEARKERLREGILKAFGKEARSGSTPQR